ncbi:hypothetical protein GS531_00160 [Rhodococcus hoagii]|nr:hypothetical protein [Prescottella equi]
MKAHRQRKRDREQQGEIEAIEAATPSEAAGVLETTLGGLREVASSTLAQFSILTRQITAAADKITDPAAVEAQLRKAAVELAETKAGYEARLTDLRAQLATAIEDRENADAAVDSVDQQLAAAHHDHQEELACLQATHAAEFRDRDQAHAAALTAVQAQLADCQSREAQTSADVEHLRERLAAETRRADSAEQRSDQIAATAEERAADLRSAADVAAQTAASTIAGLEQRIEAEHQAATAERERADSLRDDLEAARIDASAAQAEAAVARSTIDALRAELGEYRPLRSPSTGHRHS